MTLAQQNGITEFPYIITDTQGNVIYYEDSDGSWRKSEYDVRGDEIYFEDSDGYWRKSEYGIQGNVIYYETSDGTILGTKIKKPVNHSKVKLTI
jgi:hypothetical protein